jgi:hypothetical protein
MHLLARQARLHNSPFFLLVDYAPALLAISVVPVFTDLSLTVGQLRQLTAPFRQTLGFSITLSR